MDPKLNQELNNAFKFYVGRFITPVVHVSTDGACTIIGSGVRVEHKGQLYIVTANHVYERYNYSNLQIHPIPNADVTTVFLAGNGSVLRKTSDGVDIDIAVYRLPPAAIPTPTSLYFFPIRAMRSRATKYTPRVFVQGGTLVHFNKHDPIKDRIGNPGKYEATFRISNTKFLWGNYGQYYKKYSRSIDDRYHVISPYSAHPKNERTGKLEEKYILPEGYSGGGLWTIPSNLYLPESSGYSKLIESHLVLEGIITEYIEGCKYLLRATHVNTIIDVIENNIPGIEQVTFSFPTDASVLTHLANRL